jgi:hypothetical protein
VHPAVEETRVTTTLSRGLPMKIKTIQTSGWIELKKAEDEIEQDAGTAELRRMLSAAVRSQHLVVLTGLGTCVYRKPYSS